jgi:hypothetical protein
MFANRRAMIAPLDGGRLADRDYRASVALLALGVDAFDVVALVRRHRGRSEAARLDRIDERSGEGRLVCVSRRDFP